MTTSSEPRFFASFRTKLLVAMMLVVSAVTVTGMLFAQRNVAANAKREWQREFQGELAAWHIVREVRYAAQAERCRLLAQNSRIHASFEDNALDLLYPSAQDELAGMMESDSGRAGEPDLSTTHARFYRFLNDRGAVISPAAMPGPGDLTRGEETQLALPRMPDRPQVGYLVRQAGTPRETLDEVIAMPIVSTETGATIAALVLGFKPFELGAGQAVSGLRSGIWLRGRLYLPALGDAAAAVAGKIGRALAQDGPAENSFALEVDGRPSLLFYRLLNPDSLFSPAYEVCIYPLTDSLARQRRLRWQFAAGGGLLLLGALVASRLLSVRLSQPVEKLAVNSEIDRSERQRAEVALELTSQELQRSVRFSADASHQLKTPVSVLRAGLEELLAGEKLTPEIREEVSTLIHQTFRLTGVIEDLLLLSRLDAGHLQLSFSPVNLSPLIEAWLDDLGALSDDLSPEVETDMPPSLYVAGEKRYTTLILQNLLENARKYNRPGGRIRIIARTQAPWVVLAIGNTGKTIPPAAQAHIFERFHRGGAGENVPGHGLGLNLARELARLHAGDLRLARSDESWTEFEVRFHLAPAPAGNTL